MSEQAGSSADVDAVLPVIQGAEVDLERDVFTRTLLRHLAGVLQDVVGIDEAAGLVSVVGGTMGREINEAYRAALDVTELDRAQVTAVMLDLKHRINGDFFLIEASEDRLVFGNRACPFAEKVIDRPALCMMTSNVFGSIAAENLGYAKVELAETIAQGAPGCRVVVHLTSSQDAEAADGREYFSTDPTGPGG